MPIRRLDDEELARRIGPAAEEPSYVRHDSCSDDEIMESYKPRIPPKFCKPLRNLQLVEGSKAVLECTVTPQNDPTMVIEWFKDGVEILQGSRIKLALNEFGFCVLEFIDVWPRDAGVYTCKATNSCGVDSIGCSISVMRTTELDNESQLPEDMQAGYQEMYYFETLKGMKDIDDNDEDQERPIIVQAPDVVDVVEGQGAKFICRVHGNPTPKLHWYKNDEILMESRRVNVWFDGIHHLEFPRTRFYDGGNITVIARNVHGEVRHDTQLIVREKPNATSNLRHVQRSFTDTEVKKMKSGRASTEEETPELKEAFRKARVQRPDDHRLNHLDDKPIDSGSKNGSNATMTPSFVRGLKDMTLKVGEFLILDVEVAGNPSPKISFFMNSTQLKPTNRVKIDGSGNKRKVVISGARVSDSGLYECRIGNNAGSDISQARITVQPPPGQNKPFNPPGQFNAAPVNTAMGQPQMGGQPGGYGDQNQYVDNQQYNQAPMQQQYPQQQQISQPQMIPQQGGFGQQPGYQNQQPVPQNNYVSQAPNQYGHPSQPQPQQQQKPLQQGLNPPYGSPPKQQPTPSYGQNEPMGLQQQGQPMGMQIQNQPLSMQNQNQPMGAQNQNQPMGMQNQNQPMRMQNQNQPMGMQNQNQPMGMQNQHQPMGMQNQNQPMRMQQPMNQPMGMQYQNQPMRMQQPINQPMGMQPQNQPMGMQLQNQPMGMQHQNQPMGMEYQNQPMQMQMGNNQNYYGMNL